MIILIQQISQIQCFLDLEYSWAGFKRRHGVRWVHSTIFDNVNAMHASELVVISGLHNIGLDIPNIPIPIPNI